jgi:hypothetical protein
MTPTEYVALAGVVVAVFSSIFVPLYLMRRGEERATAEALEKLSKETAVSRELSWEAINAAIVKDRDGLQTQLDRANARIEACQREVDRLRQKLYPQPPTT